MNELINEESWQLTQQTFNVLREKMPLHAPEIAHWVECMISGYEAHGQYAMAQDLTQQTLDSFRESNSLCAQSVAPWVERMVLVYEAQEKQTEAWRLIQQTYEACVEHNVKFKDLGGMGVLSQLLFSSYSSVSNQNGSALLSTIPIEDRLKLLASDKLSISCRSLLLRSLPEDRSAWAAIRSHLRESYNEL